MKLGLIGKPQSGKTTIFNAAAGMQESVGDYSQAIHRAVIKVPDPRLQTLADIVQPKKITPAEIEFLDAPGLSGKGRESGAVEFNAELRQMDAYIMVVDCFSPDARPEADIRSLLEEMMLLDQLLIENAIEKKEKKAKMTGDKKEAGELDLLKRCAAHLEKELPLIELNLPDDEQKMIRGYMFLSQKPLLITLNISEEKLAESDQVRKSMAQFIQTGKRELAVVCGKIEMELVTLDPTERVSFMADLGITAPAVDQVIQKSYALLGLISFLTAGEPEVRAWTIRKGTNAQRAAGVIHSDIERGFIRAEVVAYDDYVTHKTPAAIKAAGKFRLEGKEYPLVDGDVVLFRFNV